MSENSAIELSENSAFIFWSCLNCLKTVNENFLTILNILNVLTIFSDNFEQRDNFLFSDNSDNSDFLSDYLHDLKFFVFDY